MTHKTILAAFALASATLGAHAQSAPNSPHWQLSGASGNQTITHYTDATTPSGWKLAVNFSSGNVQIRTGAGISEGNIHTNSLGQIANGGVLPLADTIYLASDFSQTRDLTAILNAVTFELAPFYAFRGEITGVEFPSTLTLIGHFAFHETTNLVQDIEIPASVTTLGSFSFRFSGITGVSFAYGSQIASIGQASFRACPNLASASFANVSLLGDIADYLFFDCPNLVSAIEIPASVKTIGTSAFNSTGITGLTFANGSTLESIGRSAFRYCYGLSGTVEIPASVESVAERALSQTGITGLTFESGSALGFIGVGAFRSNADLAEAIEIPASVTNISATAFGYIAATTVTFEPRTLPLTIEADAFRGNNSLTAITFPASVVSMASALFLDCENLASVTFLGEYPATVGTIYTRTNPDLVTYVYATHVASWQGADTTVGIISADPDSATWQSRRIVCADPENLPYYVIGFTDGKSVHQQVVEFADTGASFAPMPMRKGYSFGGWKDAHNNFYPDGHEIGTDHLTSTRGGYVVLTALWSFDGGDEAWVPVTVTGFKVDGDGNAIITWNETELMTRLGAQSPDDCEYVIHYTDSLSAPVQWNTLDGGSLATPLWHSVNALIGIDEAPGANGSMFFKVQAIKK